MKKFMKGAAITGGVCLLIGLLAVIVGAIGGGIRDIRQKCMAAMNAGSEVGDLSEIEELVDLFDGIEIMDGVTISFGMGFNSDIFEANQGKYSDGTFSIDTIDIMSADELEIIVGAGQLEVRYHEYDTIILEVGKDDRMQCFLEGNTVKIIGGTKEDNFNVQSDMIVYLPVDAVYNDILIDVAAGSLTADKLVGEDVTLDVGMGNVVINGMMVDSLDASVGMGNIELEGTITGEAVVDCGMGQIMMDILGSSKDFNYELDCGMGALNVEGVCTIAGIGEQSIDNNVSKDMEISVGMGNVDVKFSE